MGWQPPASLRWLKCIIIISHRDETYISYTDECIHSVSLILVATNMHNWTQQPFDSIRTSFDYSLWWCHTEKTKSFSNVFKFVSNAHTKTSKDVYLVDMVVDTHTNTHCNENTREHKWINPTCPQLIYPKGKPKWTTTSAALDRYENYEGD